MINTVPINEQYSLMVVTLPPAQNTIVNNNPLSTPIAINHGVNGIQLLPVNVNQSGSNNIFTSLKNRIKVNPLFNMNNNQHINNNIISNKRNLIQFQQVENIQRYEQVQHLCTNPAATFVTANNMINKSNRIHFHRQNFIKQQTVFRGMPGRPINSKNVVNNGPNINEYQQVRQNMGHIGNNHIGNNHIGNNHIGNNHIGNNSIQNNKCIDVSSKKICIPHLEKCNRHNHNHCTFGNETKQKETQNSRINIKVENKKKKNIPNTYKANNPFNLLNDNNNVTIIKISDITKQRKSHRKPQKNAEIPLKSHGKHSLFECPICHKHFTRKSNLKQHLKIHSNTCDFVCPICSRGFKQKHSMIDHIRTHTGERPYQCKYCPKAFKVKHNLTTHTRLHTGERPYFCITCNKRFVSKSSLNAHDRSKHPQKIKICI